jgi:AraC family transcriptional regulator of adaptative response / DNA-3-methyladenine glycosylase II
MARNFHLPKIYPITDQKISGLTHEEQLFKLIEGGALDGEDVASLAERLQMGERQLRRLFKQHVGAAPVMVAQTRRVLLAKQLIHQTDLPMIDVALASGFGSVRRFNETFQRLYDRPPSDLRRRRTATSTSLAAETSLLLPYRAPYDWEAMIRFLGVRAVTGLEVVTDDCYSRVIELDGVTESVARESLRLAADKMPVRTKFLTPPQVAAA